MKTLVTLYLVIFSIASFTQNGHVKGRVIDQETGEAIPFARIVLEADSVAQYMAVSDFDGLFKFENVAPGEYKLRIRFIGYDPIEENIIVKPNETSMLDYKMDAQEMPMCVCTFYFPEIDLETKNREVGAPPSTE